MSDEQGHDSEERPQKFVKTQEEVVTSPQKMAENDEKEEGKEKKGEERLQDKINNDVNVS